MKAEREVVRKIIREVGTRKDLRLWKAPAGAAVPLIYIKKVLSLLRQGKINEALLSLERAPALRYGLPGQADLTGILNDGRRLEIEVKSETGKQSDRQVKFEKMINRFNGVYIVARNVNDIIENI